MIKNMRTTTTLIFFIAVFLLSGLACNLSNFSKQGGPNGSPGFGNIGSRGESFWGTGSSTTTLTYGLMIADQKKLPCESSTKITLQILPQHNAPEESGIPPAYDPDLDYYFTAEILDPIPTFAVDAAKQYTGKCVYRDISDSVSIKIKGYYHTQDRTFSIMSIDSMYPCDLGASSIGFNELAVENGPQSINGNLACPDGKLVYATSFFLTQTPP